MCFNMGVLGMVTLCPQHAMRKKLNRNLLWMVVLGVLCTAPLGAHAVDYTYQSLTNLGPCASSRVLLMNNDTNPICPIEGQGYHDTDSNTVANATIVQRKAGRFMAKNPRWGQSDKWLVYHIHPRMSPGNEIK